MILKEGMKVKLISYAKWSDYIRHNEEIGVIIKVFDKTFENEGFECEIKWKDGECSYARKDNIKTSLTTQTTIQ